MVGDGEEGTTRWTATVGRSGEEDQRRVRREKIRGDKNRTEDE
jgi:hypothetical protein